jgi:hypothetical protein
MCHLPRPIHRKADLDSRERRHTTCRFIKSLAGRVVFRFSRSQGAEAESNVWILLQIRGQVPPHAESCTSSLDLRTDTSCLTTPGPCVSPAYASLCTICLYNGEVLSSFSSLPNPAQCHSTQLPLHALARLQNTPVCGKEHALSRMCQALDVARLSCPCDLAQVL